MGTNYLAPTWRQPENINKDRLSNYSIAYNRSNQINFANNDDWFYFRSITDCQISF